MISRPYIPSTHTPCVTIALALLFSLSNGPASADLTEMGSLDQEQAEEKVELKDMKGELNDIKKTMSEAANAMGKLGAQLSQPQIKEFHLVAKEAQWELSPGTTVAALSYNGQVPGPVVRVQEGDPVRIILHNQLNVPTSLYFHGLSLPHAVDGLPRRQSGLLGPGETYAYQFIANRAGTIWYHPQVIHADQVFAGLSGVLVVEPRSAARPYTRDYVMVIEQWDVQPREQSPAGGRGKRGDKEKEPAGGAERPVSNAVSNGSMHKAPHSVTYFTVNGKTAPAIAPIEVKKGDRIRLRIVNASQQICPLFLTGHRFEIIATNGSEAGEINPRRDTVTMQPGDRYDLEFVADNPGIWSLSSLLVSQTTNEGKFPGGIACIVRYAEAAK